MKFILAALLLISCSAAQVPDLAVGKTVPKFKLEELDEVAEGEAKGVQDYFGKKTILHIFASW